MSSDFPMGHGLYFFLTRAILCLAFFLAKRYKFLTSSRLDNNAILAMVNVIVQQAFM